MKFEKYYYLHYFLISCSSVSLAMEAIGDITASAEVSRVEVEGEDFDSRIQGGVLVRVSYVD